MRNFRKHTTTACALFLAGIFATTAFTGNVAYADQFSIEYLKDQVSQVEKEILRQTDPFEANKEDLLGNPDLLLSQTGSGRCTLAANAMMLRRAAFIEGSDDWSSITEESLGSIIWSGRGIPHEYSAFGKTVTVGYFERGEEEHKAELIDLLAEHPEGVAVYDSGVPHAVLLAAYDKDTDQFLCADPASYYGGKILEVGESWNGVKRGSSEGVLNGLNSYWTIEK